MTKREKIGILLFFGSWFGSLNVIVRDRQIDTIGGLVFLGMLLVGSAMFVFGGEE